ncbi:MAG: ATP-binding protein [Deltaproteobacteria bacterium]|nr:ATP-binding protein [Deltaproteobacteria bacterium]MBW2393279.1 ATP-binding protein [Deltaproteobacteria bacterium]
MRARLEQVLELAERWLRGELGVSADPEAVAAGRAFRFERVRGRGQLIPVPDPEAFALEGLLGVERAVARLVRNTKQFLAGHPFNHVLLYGERGTGKSSAVRGLLTRFGSEGLRVVEVRKADLAHLPDVLTLLRGRPQFFLVFCDDLSFAEGDAGYRELKAALEGSLDAPPRNVCLVATSNRRHLLPERRSENQEVRLDEDGDLHLGETIDEKLALSDRFGLMLGFFGFDQKTYLRIVEHHAMAAGIRVDPEQLRNDALRWALDRSSRSGRTARQFVNDLAGREALEDADA